MNNIRFALTPVYAPQLPQTWPTKGVRWNLASLGKWLETLPPFWQTFVFIMMMSFPMATLALSIAMVGIGPVAGAGLVLLFGLVNMFTIAAFSEAVIRSGAIRSGNAFLGRVAGDYLGRSGSMLMTLAAGTHAFLAVIAALVGLAKTLAGSNLILALVLVAVVFAFNVYRLSRQGFKLSLSVSILLAAVTIGLLLILSLFAFAHWNPAYLRPLESSSKPILQALLGVLLTSYYGQLAVSQCSRLVLPRDPSGRSLIKGSVAAYGALTLFFMVWVLAVGGVVPPEMLANASGTVLLPLAENLGPIARVLGAIVVTFLLGLATIRASDVLFNLVAERLPTKNLHQSKRTFLSVFPLIVAFVIAQWLLLSGAGSFARIVSIAGVMAVSLYSGILPVLMLYASRRKGDITPGKVYSFLGNPILLCVIYFLFLGIIFAHALVIWQHPLERTLAFALGLGIIGLTIHLLRSGVLRNYRPQLNQG